jgi:hypothetical protein
MEIKTGDKFYLGLRHLLELVFNGSLSNGNQDGRLVPLGCGKQAESRTRGKFYEVTDTWLWTETGKETPKITVTVHHTPYHGQRQGRQRPEVTVNQYQERSQAG